MAVSFQLGKGCCQIFCRGAKARAVIRSDEVVVDRLWCADNKHILHTVLFAVF